MDSFITILTILMPFITAIISGVISYKQATKANKLKIEELVINFENEISLLKTQSELKEKDMQLNLTTNRNTEKYKEALEQLNKEINKETEKKGKYTTNSIEYRESRKKQLELEKKKLELISKQIEDLESFI